MSEDDPSLGQIPGRSRATRETTPDISVAVARAAWRSRLPESAALCQKAAVAALDAAGFTPLFARIEVGVRLTDDAEVRRLNHRYRGRDSATNVLSFPATDLTPGNLPAPPAGGAPLPLGDVVLAYQTVRAEADAEGQPLADRVRHLVVHGVLHLAGYDHEDDAASTVMERLEAAVLAKLGVPSQPVPKRTPPRRRRGRARPREHP